MINLEELHVASIIQSSKAFQFAADVVNGKIISGKRRNKPVSDSLTNLKNRQLTRHIHGNSALKEHTAR